jgi:hypothetical protein
VLPLRNVTVPEGKLALGWPANAGLAKAIESVTNEPCGTPAAEVEREAVVLAFVMVKMTGGEVL